MIEEYLIRLTDAYPPWAVTVLLLAAALSFLARHRAQYYHGRIQEYEATAVGVAVALLGMTALYVVIGLGLLSLPARPGVGRVLLSLLCVALVAFNWGGATATIRDVARAAQPPIRDVLRAAREKL